MSTAKSSTAGKSPPSSPAPHLKKYLKIFLVPTLITKSCIFYFGLQYSMYPGEGYGYGLIAAITFTLSSFAYFIWSATRDEAEAEMQEAESARKTAAESEAETISPSTPDDP